MAASASPGKRPQEEPAHGTLTSDSLSHAVVLCDSSPRRQKSSPPAPFPTTSGLPALFPLASHPSWSAQLKMPVFPGLASPWAPLTSKGGPTEPRFEDN